MEGESWFHKHALGPHQKQRREAMQAIPSHTCAVPLVGRATAVQSDGDMYIYFILSLMS